ncbi:MAG TPA: cytochrome c-type biogenesis protein CcmH [Chakrabartia sp.]|nr:cytochrome c-type biogenesis protein CcmH [Chakrabartia sp.]
MRRLIAPVLLLLASPALADSLLPDAQWANTQLPDAAKEREAKALMEAVRCLVCQGQSVADSDSDLAGDMRSLIRTRIAAGEKPDAIKAWLIERYGNWISYEPPMSAITAPLWIMPLLLLVLGVWLARGRFRKRKAG